jgi:hypothetical protein
MPDAKENFYTNLKTLIWGAFVGIVSFQILGPNLATAIHKQLGCSEQKAYDLFSRAYLLLPSLISLFFVIREFHLLRKFLRPFDQDRMDWASGLLIWGIMGLWVAQVGHQLSLANWVFFPLRAEA